MLVERTAAKCSLNDPELVEEKGGVVDDEPAAGVFTGVDGSLGLRRARP